MEPSGKQGAGVDIDERWKNTKKGNGQSVPAPCGMAASIDAYKLVYLAGRWMPGERK